MVDIFLLETLRGCPRFAALYTTNIINCAQVGASLTTKQGAVKEKMRICFNINVAWTKCIQSILKTMFELVLTLATFYLTRLKSKESNLNTISNRLPYYSFFV